MNESRLTELSFAGRSLAQLPGGFRAVVLPSDRSFFLMEIEKNTSAKSVDSALATIPHPASSMVFANGATTWLSLGSHRCRKDRKLVEVHIESCGARNGQRILL